MLCLHRFRKCITEVFSQRIAVSSIQLSQKEETLEMATKNGKEKPCAFLTYMAFNI